MRSPLHRPILIQRFYFALSDDVGGWTDRPYTFRSLSSLGPMPEMLFDDDDEVEESGKKEEKGDEGEKEDGSSSKTREAKENVRVAKEKERDEFRRGIPHYGGIEYRPVPPDRFYRFANDTSAQKAKKKSLAMSLTNLRSMMTRSSILTAAGPTGGQTTFPPAITFMSMMRPLSLMAGSSVPRTMSTSYGILRMASSAMCGCWRIIFPARPWSSKCYARNMTSICRTGRWFVSMHWSWSASQAPQGLWMHMVIVVFP